MDVIMMVDKDYVVDKVLDKIKEWKGIEKFDDTKILISTVDKLPNELTLKKSCTINDMCIKD